MRQFSDFFPTDRCAHLGPADYISAGGVDSFDWNAKNSPQTVAHWMVQKRDKKTVNNNNNSSSSSSSSDESEEGSSSGVSADDEFGMTMDDDCHSSATRLHESTGPLSELDQMEPLGPLPELCDELGLSQSGRPQKRPRLKFDAMHLRHIACQEREATLASAQALFDDEMAEEELFESHHVDLLRDRMQKCALRRRRHEAELGETGPDAAHRRHDCATPPRCTGGEHQQRQLHHRQARAGCAASTHVPTETAGAALARQNDAAQ